MQLPAGKATLQVVGNGVAREDGGSGLSLTGGAGDEDNGSDGQGRFFEGQRDLSGNDRSDGPVGRGASDQGVVCLGGGGGSEHQGRHSESDRKSLLSDHRGLRIALRRRAFGRWSMVGRMRLVRS